MEKTEILKELNEYLKSENIVKLLNLKEKLEIDIREASYVTAPSAKKRLSGIKRVILNKCNECRPILQSFCRFEDGVAFTDSYQLYYLKDEFLPFNVAMTKYDSDDEIKNYASEHQINVTPGIYPDLKNVIPDSSLKSEEYEIDINEILSYIKTTPKDGNKCLYYFDTKENGKMCVDALYIKNCIDILGLKDNFKMEIYGYIRPIIIRGNDEEYGLLLPIKTC